MKRLTLLASILLTIAATSVQAQSESQQSNTIRRTKMNKKKTTSAGLRQLLSAIAITALLSALLSPLSVAQEFVWAADFPVGSTLPDISSLDQNGSSRNFENLKGEKGLVFLLSRSFNW